MSGERPTPVDRRPPQRGRLIRWVAAGVLLLPVAWYAYVVADMPDRGAEADIRAAGGTLQRDTVAPALALALDNWVLTYGPIFRVSYGGPVTRAKLEPLTRLTALRDLDLVTAEGSDPAAWGLIARLPTLEGFAAVQTDIRDENLAHLAALPALRRVSLAWNPNLTRAAVEGFMRTRPDVRVIYEPG